MLHQWQFSLMRGGRKHGILFWLGAWSATAIATGALILGITFVLDRRPAEFSAAGIVQSGPAERPSPLEPTPAKPPPEAFEPLAAGKFPRSSPQGFREDGYPIAAAAPTTRLSDADRMGKRKEALEHLPAGKIVIEAPTLMKVGDKRKIEATAGIGIDPELLKNAKPGNQKYEGLLRVSAEMIATLTGPGFKIEATTPEQQPMTEGYPTVWSWNIEAVDDGEQELEATLYVLLFLDAEKPDRQRIGSFVQKISVSVRPLSWGEWFMSCAKEFDAAKGIAVGLFGLGTLALSWFGTSLTRRNPPRTAVAPPQD
jgi:predicted secreted protein